MIIKEAVISEDVSYREFYNALQEKSIGFWDNINSTEIIQEYLCEKIKEDIIVSHILKALEDNESKHNEWCIWLGNSMETPTPINNKEDLIEALCLDREDLEKDLNIKIEKDGVIR